MLCTIRIPVLHQHLRNYVLQYQNDEVIRSVQHDRDVDDVRHHEARKSWDEREEHHHEEVEHDDVIRHLLGLVESECMAIPYVAYHAEADEIDADGLEERGVIDCSIDELDGQRHHHDGEHDGNHGVAEGVEALFELLHVCSFLCVDSFLGPVFLLSTIIHTISFPPFPPSSVA